MTITVRYTRNGKRLKGTIEADALRGIEVEPIDWSRTSTMVNDTVRDLYKQTSRPLSRVWRDFKWLDEPDRLGRSLDSLRWRETTNRTGHP
jgi:hypothetical protein